MNELRRRYAPGPPPTPVTPQTLEDFLREIQRPPPQVYAPLQPVVPKFCRYHQGVRAAAVVMRSGSTVFLCPACGKAVADGALVILDALGRWRGKLPTQVNLPKS